MGWLVGPWNPATVSALAGLFGSFVGAFSSTVSAWVTQRHHDRNDLLAKKIAHREQLYSDFISESARAMVDGMQHKFEDPANSRRFTRSSVAFVWAPRQVWWRARNESLKPSLLLIRSRTLTAEEIQSGVSIRDDPPREFSIICRHELESLRGSL